MNSNNFSLSDLRCNARVNPLGTGDASPNLSWKLIATDPDYRGLRQVSYRVRIASQPEILADSPDLWDSGDIASDQSVGVAYAGKPLSSGERAYWNVSVTNETGETATSETAFWEAGLLNRADWEPARWIGGELVGGPRTTVPLPYLRRTFTLDSVPANVRLNITALGLYRVYINGVRVGEDELTPGWTDYNKRVQYQTYDVSTLLKSGENVIAAVLGDGWYSGYVAWQGRERYGDNPKLLAVLTADNHNLLVTDDKWKVAYGPLLEADLLMGETFDARREWRGWNTASFTEGSEWVPVRLADIPESVELSPMIGPTVKVAQELAPIDEPQVLHRWPQKEYIFDFGQNLVGRVRLQIKSAIGTTIRLRYAETLKGGPASNTGDLYTENLRSATQTDYYTCTGDADGETWEPMFTFHGFRYVEIQGLPNPPAKSDVTAIVLHSDTPQTGDFECSDPLLNQLQKNIDWGQRGNFVDIPTDCPQRDERLGWTGDAQVFIRTAAWNRDVQGFFQKWFRDMRDSQGTEGQIPSVIPEAGGVPSDGGPAWADAGVICPWTMYLTYGDKTVLETQYESMARFVAYLQSIEIDGLRSHPDFKGFHGFGDWLAQDGAGKSEGGTPKDLIGTAFTAYCATLMEKIATVLGKTDDAAQYKALFEKTRETFTTRYVTPGGLVYPGTQTAYCLALYFDLLPESLRPAATEALVTDIKSRGHKLTTGFVGSPYLPHVLSENGRADIAYKLLHQKQWPSYLYAVTQGATTIWERWDGWTHDKGFQDVGMNSFNHYAYGAIGAWMYQRVAGIDIDEAKPGYKHIILKPLPFGSDLTHARAHLETVYGRVESSWRLEEDTLTWEIIVPPNTTATAYLPADLSLDSLTEGGKAVSEATGIVAESNGVLQLVPGKYAFTAHINKS